MLVMLKTAHEDGETAGDMTASIWKWGATLSANGRGWKRFHLRPCSKNQRNNQAPQQHKTERL